MKLKNQLRSKYVANESLRNTEIDIILPTYNRFKPLNKAVESVKRQVHANWKLYICDDGSTDETSQKYGDDSYNQDLRIKYLNLNHKGVSAARNCGLKRANNSFVSFIDSDNTWSPEYLSLMLSFMDEFSLDSAYCAARLIGDHGEQWLGDYFSWQACAKQNYIDINCFMLKKITHDKLFFDESLKRFVDWDYILEATKKARTSYLALPLVNYCNKKSRQRITTSVYQGNEFFERVKEIQARHDNENKQNANLDVRVAPLISR
ncbi:glycosyltransferase [Synechococcus sp. AH-601-B19]|nr:glycosyltransferase [Synechococcus sp. AH-601-B19]